MKKNPYDVMDVEKNQDIDHYRKKYRSLVKQYHPDMGGSEKKFIEIKDAYNQIKKDIESNENGNIVENIINNKSNKSESNVSDHNKYTYPCTVRYINYNIIKNNKNISENEIFDNCNLNRHKKAGKFNVNKGETILEGAEKNNNNWPYSCRGGACSNCAIKIINGDVETSKIHILPEKLLDEGYRLSCIGKPLTENVDIIYNINQHKDIQDYLLPSKS